MKSQDCKTRDVNTVDHPSSQRDPSKPLGKKEGGGMTRDGVEEQAKGDSSEY